MAIAGPEGCSAVLRAPGPITIGRSAYHVLTLNDPRVSRDHAVLTYAQEKDEDGSMRGQWRIADSGSRHGTWLNGLRLTPERPLPVRLGDRIVIAPWTFQIVPAGETQWHGPRVATLTDSPNTTVSKIDVGVADALAAGRLALLLQCAGAIHSARDEAALAEAIVQAAVSGTGFANVALLRAGERLDEVSLIAHRGQVVSGTSPARLSRSLLEQASKGTPARMTRRDEMAAPAVSIVELGIEEALCVPILLEGKVAGFLYLDNRGRSGRVVGDAAGFAIGLTRLAALAWANLRRMEVERRSARMEAELSAAGRMQSLLLPPREGEHGVFRYRGQSRPGRYVGGDFFDVMPLGPDRMAVAVGDVSGKGVEAAVLITASQGFLHAALQEHGDPGRAITELNRFVYPRAPVGKFITLWMAVLDHAEQQLRVVDAGHGHAFMVTPDGAVSSLAMCKSYPVSVMEETIYTAQTLPLPESGRLLVLSDGLLEEPAPAEPGDSGRTRQFSVEGVQRCLQSLPPGADEVSALFAAVEAYAQTDQLADDATAVVVRW